MMKKLGRNDRCHCNSGKKYKNCHWQDDQLLGLETKVTQPSLAEVQRRYAQTVSQKSRDKTSSFTAYAESHDTAAIINFITNLQLLPENHGKNLRIEEMAKEIVKRMNNNEAPDINELKRRIIASYPLHHGEDPPEGLFTESMLFHGGNYIVMPGIASKSIDILKAFTESIFLHQIKLPESFKLDIYQGVSLLLEIGQFIFEKAGLLRYQYSESTSRTIVFPEQIMDCSFGVQNLQEICERRGIEPSKIMDFVTQFNDPKLQHDDPDLNPLLYKPLIEINERFYFSLISAQGMVLNEYIISTAIKYGCSTELLNEYHQNVWSNIRHACLSMDWKPTTIEVPAQTQLPLKEEIFFIDNNRFAYVVQVCHESITDKYGEREHFEKNKGNRNALDQHIDQVMSSFAKSNRSKNWKFLIVVLIEDIGRYFLLSIGRPEGDQEKIWFSCFEFLHLAKLENWGRLSLLKFARVHNEYRKKVDIISTDMIDIYSIYKNSDESFYVGDESYNFMTVLPGEGAELLRQSKQRQDLHGAPYYDNGRLIYKLVQRTETFAPIYAPFDDKRYCLLLESFRFPLWIECKPSKKSKEIQFVHNTTQAIFYWLNNLAPFLKDLFEQHIKEPLVIQLRFDEVLFADMSFQKLRELKLQTGFSSSYSDHTLDFQIPGDLLNQMEGKTNKGERWMMKALLQAFNNVPGVTLPEERIDEVLAEEMPESSRKMILFLDSQMDFQLDTRWLPPTHYVTSAEINLLLDRLVAEINYPTKIPEQFNTTAEKRAFCNYVVQALLQKLQTLLSAFDSERLLKMLIALHEKLIFKREHNKILIPSQILCFGHDDEHVQTILKNEKKLVLTSLAIRSLIELIAGEPGEGKGEPSLDEIDILLAYMDEILTYGMISDAIHFKLDDPKIGLLSSARIGIGKSFFDDRLQPFSKANQQSDIDDYLEGFEDKFETWSPQEPSGSEKELMNKVDSAFLKDWQISFANLDGILFASIQIAIQMSNSVISMPKEEFFAQIVQITKISNEELTVGLDRLTLRQRNSYLIAPEGYKNEEVFPWKYNREFSVIRRPFIELRRGSSTLIVWGMRQAAQASRQLHQLLTSGRIKYGGTEINKLLGEQNEAKGKRFRNNVKDWFKPFKHLNVWEHEVMISPHGHLKADKNLGDIDLLVFDTISHDVYSIECKRTQQAKNIHEMKKELDSYLGRELGTGMIQKHVVRHEWLANHLDELKNFMGYAGKIKLHSLLLTSEVIPIIYIKAGELPLPIISYPDLKRNGSDMLRAIY